MRRRLVADDLLALTRRSFPSDLVSQVFVGPTLEGGGVGLFIRVKMARAIGRGFQITAAAVVAVRLAAKRGRCGGPAWA